MKNHGLATGSYEYLEMVRRPFVAEKPLRTIPMVPLGVLHATNKSKFSGK
jgi:hypothetical protein